MLKKTIKFENHDGEEMEGDFYFNMSKQELTEMALKNGGFERILEDLGNAESAMEGYELFKEVVLSSYGIKADDGVSFLKRDANGRRLSEQFEQHPACSELIIELLQDGDAALAFIQGLFPAKHREAIAQAVKDAENKNAPTGVTPISKVEDVELPAAAPVLTDEEPKKFEDFSRQELIEMSREAFDALLPKQSGAMTQQMLSVAMERRSKGL